MRSELSATVLRLPDGRDLAYSEFGDPDGVPVFAFHGTPGSRLQLAPLSDEAKAAGVRLVVADRPGYGHSDYVAHRRLLDWPRDVAAIADHLGIDRFAVLGVSGGGPHALSCGFALARRVTAVVAISSPAPRAVTSWVRRAVRRVLTTEMLEALLLPFAALLVAVMRHLPRLAFSVARRWSPAADRRVMDLDEYRTWFAETVGHTSATTARAAAQDTALFQREWGFALHGISVPVHLWHGDSDKLVPPGDAHALERAVPDATLHMCADEGHLLLAARAPEILGALGCIAAGDARTSAAAST